MRKLFYILLLSVSLFVGCSNADEVVTNDDHRVVLEARPNSITRVAFNGQASSWESGDVLNVVVEGLDDVYEFQNTSSNTFVCDNISLPASSNNIYAIYGANPDDINISDKTALVHLGATSQEQNSQNPTSHISDYDILYGAAMGADKDNITITMNHTVCVLKVDITNAMSQPQTIKSVAVATPYGVAINGDYNIPLDGSSAPALVPNSCTNRATVTFNGVELQKGSTPFTAWLAVAPFALDSGKEITIEVTTSDDTTYSFVKTISDQAGKTFDAGSVMSTSVELDEKPTTDLPSEIDYTLEISRLASCGGFPTNANNGVTKGAYTIDGYTFEFTSPTKFYLDNNIINFAGGGVNNTTPAKIKLPVISGYKLVAVTLASTASNKDREYQFSIINSNGDYVEGGKRVVLSEDPTTYTLSGTSDSPYFIKISRTSNHKEAAVLSHLSLKYVKM